MDFKRVDIKKLQYINEFLTEQMNHWMLFPLVLLICVYARRAVDFSGILTVAVWMICSFLPLIFFVLRLKVRSAARFLILQPVAALLPVGGAFAVLTFGGSMFYTGRVACIICTVCYMFYSALLYLKKTDPFTGSMQLSVGVAIAAGCMFLERVSGADLAAWMGYHIFPLILSVGLFFIVIYIQRYIDFLNVNKSSAGCLPAAEMLHSGLGLAMGYTAFGVLLTAILASGPWLGQLGTSLQRLLGYLLKRLKGIIKGNAAEDEIPINQDFGDIPSQIPDFKINETFWLWTVLEYVMIFALAAALLFLLVKVLIKLIQYLQRFALSRISAPDVEDEEAFDIHEKCDIDEKSGRRDRKRYDPFSHRDRIRRLYRHKILSSTGRMSAEESRMLGIYTAKEWERRLDTKGMAELYGQARYSTREMTAEDVKRMRDACR